MSPHCQSQGYHKVRATNIDRVFKITYQLSLNTDLVFFIFKKSNPCGNPDHFWRCSVLIQRLGISPEKRSGWKGGRRPKKASIELILKTCSRKKREGKIVLTLIWGLRSQVKKSSPKMFLFTEYWQGYKATPSKNNSKQALKGRCQNSLYWHALFFACDPAMPQYVMIFMTNCDSTSSVSYRPFGNPRKKDTLGGWEQ